MASASGAGVGGGQCYRRRLRRQQAPCRRLRQGERQAEQERKFDKRRTALRALADGTPETPGVYVVTCPNCKTTCCPTLDGAIQWAEYFAHIDAGPLWSFIDAKIHQYGRLVGVSDCYSRTPQMVESPLRPGGLMRERSEADFKGLYGCWQPLAPADVASLFEGAPFGWWIAGGWAADVRCSS
jgi:hypothetical protein